MANPLDSLVITQAVARELICIEEIDTVKDESSSAFSLHLLSYSPTD